MTELLNRWYILHVRNPRWRSGQALFNALHELHPSIADRIRGSHVDPYFKDTHIAALLLKLRESYPIIFGRPAMTIRKLPATRQS